MITDCYTHTWLTADQLGRCVPTHRDLRAPARTAVDPNVTGHANHFAACEPVGTTIVLGFKSHYQSAEISNDEVASYVAQHPDRLIGFAGVDPSRPKEAIAELNRSKDRLGLRGIAVAPAAQDVHPTSSQAMLVYAEAADRGMPVIFHTGVFTSAAAKLEYARPILLDEVARELPKLKIVIAHLGFPWVNETLALLAKHRNVYTETSRLLHQPWQAYQALRSAYQLGVADRVLFGSGFPSATAAECIEALYSLNHLVHGTNLPSIPREELRSIVERDAPGLLGVAPPREPAQLQPTTTNPR